MACIRSIKPFAAFKIGFAIFGILGAVAGVLCSTFAFAGVHLSSLTGALALVPLIVCPVAWGLAGSVAAVVFALLYNLGASWIGGLDVEIR